MLISCLYSINYMDGPYVHRIQADFNRSCELPVPMPCIVATTLAAHLVRMTQSDGNFRKFLCMEDEATGNEPRKEKHYVMCSSPREDDTGSAADMDVWLVARGDDGGHGYEPRALQGGRRITWTACPRGRSSSLSMHKHQLSTATEGSTMSSSLKPFAAIGFRSPSKTSVSFRRTKKINLSAPLNSHRCVQTLPEDAFRLECHWSNGRCLSHWSQSEARRSTSVGLIK